MSIARYLNPANDDGSFLSGVPKRDIEEAEWERLPAHLQRSVDASPLYRKTPPPKTKPDKEETD